MTDANPSSTPSDPAAASRPSTTLYATARELFAALASHSLQVRVHAISQIGADPRAAYLLGKHDGQDLLDVLMRLLRAEPPGSVLAHAFARILCGFADARVSAFFTDQVREWNEFALLEPAIAHLSAVSPDSIRGLLFETDRRYHRHAAARALLSVHVPLTPKEKLRATLLEALEPPAITPENLPDWLHEFAGPLQQAAVSWVGCQSPLGIQTLLGAWNELSPKLRIALLHAAKRISPTSTLPVLHDAFASESHELVIAAFQCLAATGSAGDAVRPPLSQFLGRSSVTLVSAAILHAAMDIDLHEAFETATDIDIRCALVRRRAKDAPLEASNLWLDALTDPHWQMRALAVRQLVGMGPRIHEQVRSFLSHAQPEVRLAAAQALSLSRPPDSVDAPATATELPSDRP